jgi:hypothetical protein
LNGLEIGRIVASHDQTDYVIQVNASGDVALPPTPIEYGFGQFVGLPIEADLLVGLIYTTQLINPAYGALGPRLSTEQELPVFSPDYLPETATVVGVTVVGTIRHANGRPTYDQATPVVAPTIDSPVHLLSDDEFLAFHFPNGRLRLAYFPRLLSRPFPSLADLLSSILDRLAVNRPDEQRRLDVTRRNIRWRAIVGEGR